MNKKWHKIADDNYVFTLDDIEVGNIKLHFNSNKSLAEVTLLGKEIKIYKTGFWKNQIEISDNNNNIISTIKGEKWYGTSYIIELDSKLLKLVVRNNPLAEWAIFYNEELLLAYGLDTSEGNVKVKISQSENNTINEENDYILDFLLWYLFLPIATENTTSDFFTTFLLTIA